MPHPAAFFFNFKWNNWSFVSCYWFKSCSPLALGFCVFYQFIRVFLSLKLCLHVFADQTLAELSDMTQCSLTLVKRASEHICQMLNFCFRLCRQNKTKKKGNLHGPALLRTVMCRWCSVLPEKYTDSVCCECSVRVVQVPHFHEGFFKLILLHLI